MSSSKVRFLALTGLLLPAAARAQVPVGSEFRANAYTTSDQEQAAVAADAAGNFVLVWRSIGQDGSSSGIFGRWHDASGAPLGATEFRINAYTTGDQISPRVAMSATGETVVVWNSASQNGIYARRYPSVGAAPEAEFRVSDATASLESQPDIEMMPDGRFVVVWSSLDGGAFDILARRYPSGGGAPDAVFRVNSFTTGSQRYPSVALDADANFLVAWQDPARDGSGRGVYARFVAADGSMGSEFRVNTYTTGIQEGPHLGAAPDGSFVATWSSVQEGDGYGVFARRISAGATAFLGPEFQVNVETAGNQYNAQVAVDAAGRFTVAWTGLDGSSLGVRARRFDALGVPEGDEFRINAHTTDLQTWPAIAADDSLRFVVTWTSSNQDGHLRGVYARRFLPSLIFRDGFEQSTLDAWSAQSTDGGDLSVTSLAALDGSAAGMQGVVDDQAGLFVEDRSPNDEREYHARFHFDTNAFDPGEALEHRRTRLLIAFSEAPTRRVAAVVLRRLNGQYAIRARARLDDDTQADSDFVPITDGPHVIELWLQAAATPGGSNGFMVLYVDGQPEDVMIGLSNHLAAVDFARMGALSVKPGASGTLYWDEFESRRDDYIGP